MRHIRLFAASLAALAVLALAVAPAAAGWEPGDAYKMHYPQLPDPNGWDVNFTFGRLADDWQCTGTGPVSGIHFWFSMHEDYIAELKSIYVGIHANDTSGQFSKLGELLWERRFERLWDEPFEGFQYEIRPYGTGAQGFYDVLWGGVYPDNHQNYYQANITDIQSPFWQEEGTVYWLELSVVTESGRAGWKTSASQQFMDRAVYGATIYAPPVWSKLYDPSIQYTRHPFSGDFAFVITTVPEPSTFIIWSLLGALGITVGWWRRRSHDG